MATASKDVKISHCTRWKLLNKKKKIIKVAKISCTSGFYITSIYSLKKVQLFSVYCIFFSFYLTLNGKVSFSNQWFLWLRFQIIIRVHSNLPISDKHSIFTQTIKKKKL